MSGRPPQPRAGSAARRSRGTTASARAADRFTARSRRRMLRRLLTGFAVALGMAAVGAVVWLLGWSDATALEEVRVDGVDDELGDAVVEVADPPLGMPLIRVDTTAMEEAVTGLPEVAGVSVTRSWPNAVTIDVIPRAAEAAIADGQSWWLVDSTGVLFSESSAPPDGLPVLDAPTDAEAGPARAAGVAVLTGLPGQLHDLVTAVAAPTEASIELTLTDGATVLWGTADQADRKAAVLTALLATEATHYDVSAPGKPAVRH